MNIQDRYRAFFLAKLTAKTDVGGVWHYAWYEQIFDPLTGTPTDANPGRTGTATISPALEANNAALDFTDGPIYTFIKQKGIVNGQVVYEFVASSSSGTIFTGSAPEYRTRCLNGYFIEERATISLNGSGLSQTEYVFEKSLGTRCFETSGSGASGSGSGGSGAPTPPVTSQTIVFVTNVCPIYADGSGSGTGGFMTGFTLEKARAVLPPGTVVTPVLCVESPNDCCSGSGLVGDCCAGLTPQESTPWGMSGSFGPSGTEAIVNGVAERTDPTGLYYTDVLPAETGTSYATFNMYCSDGQWIASGVVSLSALGGAILNYNIPLELVGGLLVGEIETPEDLGVITLVVIPPCGGTDPKGCYTCQACLPFPVSTKWVASFGAFSVALFLDPAAPNCYFQSHDGDWVLEPIIEDSLWRLTGTEGRSWVLDDGNWNCCEANVMISEQEELPATLTPSVDCCPVVDCVVNQEQGAGVTTSSFSGCDSCICIDSSGVFPLVNNGDGTYTIGGGAGELDCPQGPIDQELILDYTSCWRIRETQGNVATSGSPPSEVLLDPSSTASPLMLVFQVPYSWFCAGPWTGTETCTMIIT